MHTEVPGPAQQYAPSATRCFRDSRQQHGAHPPCLSARSCVPPAGARRERTRGAQQRRTAPEAHPRGQAVGTVGSAPHGRRPQACSEERLSGATGLPRIQRESAKSEAGRLPLSAERLHLRLQRVRQRKQHDGGGPAVRPDHASIPVARAGSQDLQILRTA